MFSNAEQGSFFKLYFPTLGFYGVAWNIQFCLQVYVFFLWKQAPFRWCVLKIQKDLTGKMGFLHFCCWITKCNFVKEKKVQGVSTKKNNKCQITVPSKALPSEKKEKGKCFVAINVIKHGYFLRYKFGSLLKEIWDFLKNLEFSNKSSFYSKSYRAGFIQFVWCSIQLWLRKWNYVVAFPQRAANFKVDVDFHGMRLCFYT